MQPQTTATPAGYYNAQSQTSEKHLVQSQQIPLSENMYTSAAPAASYTPQYAQSQYYTTTSENSTYTPQPMTKGQPVTYSNYPSTATTNVSVGAPPVYGQTYQVPAATYAQPTQYDQATVATNYGAANGIVRQPSGYGQETVSYVQSNGYPTASNAAPVAQSYVTYNSAGGYAPQPSYTTQPYTTGVPTYTSAPAYAQTTQYVQPHMQPNVQYIQPGVQYGQPTTQYTYSTVQYAQPGYAQSYVQSTPYGSASTYGPIQVLDPKMNAQDLVTQASKTFDEYDLDKNGLLSLQEVKGVLDKVCHVSKIEKIADSDKEKFFYIFDADKDNVINLEEFVALFKVLTGIQQNIARAQGRCV